MEREGVSTLSIRSYLQDLQLLAHLKCLVFVCMKKYFEKTPQCGELCNVSRVVENVYKVSLKIFFLKRVYVWKVALFEQASKNYLPTRKGLLFSFRRCYPTISEQVALFVGCMSDIQRDVYTVTKATGQETLVTTLGFLRSYRGNVERVIDERMIFKPDDSH